MLMIILNEDLDYLPYMPCSNSLLCHILADCHLIQQNSGMCSFGHNCLESVIRKTKELDIPILGKIQPL